MSGDKNPETVNVSGFVRPLLAENLSVIKETTGNSADRYIYGFWVFISAHKRFLFVILLMTTFKKEWHGCQNPLFVFHIFPCKSTFIRINVLLQGKI